MRTRAHNLQRRGRPSRSGGLAQAQERGGWRRRRRRRRRGGPGEVEPASLPGPPCLWPPVGTEAVRDASSGVGEFCNLVSVPVREMTSSTFSPHDLPLAEGTAVPFYRLENKPCRDVALAAGGARSGALAFAAQGPSLDSRES